jgi:hypothetical protein
MVLFSTNSVDQQRPLAPRRRMLTIFVYLFRQLTASAPALSKPTLLSFPATIPGLSNQRK